MKQKLNHVAAPWSHRARFVTLMGARIAFHIALPERPAWGPKLIDSESSDDGAMLHSCTTQVAHPQHTRHYVVPTPCDEIQFAGRIPPWYHQPPKGTHNYFDGSHQMVEVAGATYEAAGAAITKAPLQVVTRVTSPQRSYRAEM